jgi:protein-tyrosine phosphatase
MSCSKPTDTKKTTQFNILFVCTGNTCRSPMAEGICRKILSIKKNCSIDQLKKNGYNVESAGIYAFSGSAVSVEAVNALKDLGIDISGHRSRLLAEKDVRQADVIFALTQGHLEFIVNNWEFAKDKTVLLDNDDIKDPIGLGNEVYWVCAKQIENAILKRLGEYIK